MHVWQLFAAFERLQKSRLAQQNHVQKEDLARFALDAVDPVERLNIELHARECQKCRKKVEESQVFSASLQALRQSQLQITGKDRRSEVRYEVTEPAIITASRADDFEPFECSVMDVSEFGLHVRGPREMYRGTDVRVRVENAVAFGTIRYSRRVSEGAFDSGIEIEQVIIGSDSAQQRNRTRTATVTPSPPVPRQPVEILLVEDNPADVKLTLHALRKRNLSNQIEVARDGEEALDYLFCRGKFSQRSFEQAPRLVLLDLKLPKVDGLQVLRQLKTDARTKAIPVIVMTSSKEDRDLVESYQLGVNSYIQKPVDFDKFQQVVEQLELYWLVVNQAPPADAFKK